VWDTAVRAYYFGINLPKLEGVEKHGKMGRGHDFQPFFSPQALASINKKT